MLPVVLLYRTIVGIYAKTPVRTCWFYSEGSRAVISAARSNLRRKVIGIVWWRIVDQPDVVAYGGANLTAP